MPELWGDKQTPEDRRIMAAVRWSGGNPILELIAWLWLVVTAPYYWFFRD